MTVRALQPGPGQLGPGQLGLGLAVSVLLHLALGLGLVTLMRPGRLADQPLPKSELRIETEAVAEERAAPRDAAGRAAPQAAPRAEVAPEGMAASTSAPSARPAPPLQAALAPKAQPAAQVRAETQALVEASPPAPQAASALTPQSLAAASLAALAPPAQSAPAQEAAPQAIPASAPDVAPVKATLAWGGSEAGLDPVSLAAVASFMRPADAAPDALHDGIGALLAGVDCARLQVEFDPQTGALDLRGHVPDAAQKAPLLAALQAEIGPGIAVRESLVLLPRPQCGALAGIADLGLPQSQDQLTNPRLIGADAQARTFTYGAGQSMVLDLAAPDYDAYLYVDYFDAAGNVIHLTPNDRVPLRLRQAGTALKVGAQDQGEPFLQITVGPPFGQEIAVAFASSAPLHPGDRPLSEPAGPYLRQMKAWVAEARARDPGFKGEWVYFMVVTQP